MKAFGGGAMYNIQFARFVMSFTPVTGRAYTKLTCIVII